VQGLGKSGIKVIARILTRKLQKRAKTCKKRPFWAANRESYQTGIKQEILVGKRGL